MSCVGKNIEFLYKSLDLNQEQFAKIIGVSNSTLSKYKREREPNDYSILDSISNFFGITLEQLTSLDFANSNISLPSKLKAYRIFQLYPYFFPFVDYTYSSSENDGAFNHAYKIHKEVEYNIMHYFYNSNICDRCFDALIEAYKEYLVSMRNHNNIASKINILGIMLFIWTSTYNIQIEIPNTKDCDFKFADILHEQSKILSISSNEWNENQIKLFNIFDDLYIEIIKELKSSQCYEIADFYIAAKYLFGMVDSNNSNNTLRTVGFEMLSTLVQIGNQYAASFLDKGCDILD